MVEVNDVGRKGRDDADMASKLRHMDDRFTIEEMVSATELQETPIARLQERLESQLKLLITSHQRPVGVMLPFDAFRALVRRYAELEEFVEEMEARTLIDERMSHDLPGTEWVSHDDFLKEFHRRSEATLQEE